MTPRPENGPDNGDDVDARTLAELHRLARSRPQSGRGQLAKLGAIRALERLNRGRLDDIPPCPPDWHPGPPQFELLDRVYLDEHHGVRERWWRALWG